MTKSKSKGPAKSSAEGLVKTSKTAAVELSEKELHAVSGGKAKTADKAYTQMDGYIKQ
jgi:hypothetical protein